MDEQELRAKLAEARSEAQEALNRAARLDDMLDGPRVIPVLCYWRHYSYEEEEAVSETLEDAFSELEGMEEYGTASTVGVRIGGHLITHPDRGERTWRNSKAERADADRRHREMVLAEMTDA